MHARTGCNWVVFERKCDISAQNLSQTRPIGGSARALSRWCVEVGIFPEQQALQPRSTLQTLD